MDPDTIFQRFKYLSEQSLPFRPYATYDVVDDSVTVKLEDLSYSEQCVAESIDLYVANHTEAETIIGFKLYDVNMHLRHIPAKENKLTVNDLLAVYIRKYVEAATLQPLVKNVEYLELELEYCTECKSWTDFLLKRTHLCESCSVLALKENKLESSSMFKTI